MGPTGEMMFTYSATNALLQKVAAGPIFTVFLPARSWEMPLERELPAKIGRWYEKLLGHNFNARAKSSLEKIFIYISNILSGLQLQQ